MCGYCIEGSVTLEYIESGHINLENQWASIYLQETTDLNETLEETKTLNRFDDSIGIVFCRMYEQFIAHGFNNLYQHIETVFKQTTTDQFLIERRNCQEDKIWQTLGNPQIYQDKHSWDQFISNRNQLIAASEKLLWLYYDFWLADKEERPEDPLAKVVKFGQKYQLDIPPPKDKRRFNTLFPAIYFALEFLAKHHPRSSALIQLALKNPDVPDFDGNDLWLQRKAFMACLKEYGFQFIAYHFKNIRFELMAYALLKGTIKDDKLHKLSELITINGQDGIIYMSASDLLKLTESYKRLSG
jgi:hypothetical protein